MSDLLLATTNPGKQREFKRLLQELPGRVMTPQELGLDLEVAEPHHVYAQNASDKAVAFCRASGMAALADDSGLEVASLDWGPGVRTGRFGGPRVTDPVGYLLDQLRGVDDRRARMVCWLALAIPGTGPDGTPRSPRVELFSGVLEGSVARERRGEGGFGYDPIFLLRSGQTTAELADGDKDRLSHRGKAVAAALPRLRQVLQ
ncbi:MAG: non-canonical purine NTP pyrophosphatase [Chloroflexi bacterium]|nr:MAG: non-canonical purine NTP pyrophosphatase [Chloroflexota bacterium]